MLAAFHKATPQHEVVTVWLEPTDYQGGPPTNPFPSLALDQLLVASLGRAALFAPADLMKTNCQAGQSLTLTQLVNRCGFPPTDALRGKFIFVLMDANPPDEQQALIQYLGNDLVHADPTTRLAFIGPEAVPNQAVEKIVDWNGAAVFFNHNGGFETKNLHYDPQSTPGDTSGRGTVRNCCAGVNACSAPSNADWTTMLTAKTQHMGTNCINYETSPWAVTHNAHGWPFRCIQPEECTTKVEPTDVVGVQVSSGDLDGTADDFGFAYERMLEGAQQWQMDAFVSAAGSHTNEWAKGCLMSRQTLEADSPYFAVCRPDWGHNLRVQWRAKKGGSTGIYESSVSPTSNAPFVRLLSTPGNSGTCFSGLMGDGENYPDGFSTCIEGEFLFRGLAASSHSDPTAQMLFGAVTVTSASHAANYSNSTHLPGRAHIGSQPNGSCIAFDGPIGP